MRRAGVLLGAVLMWAASVGTAKAEPSIDVRTFRPSTDPSANLILEPTTTPGPWNFNAGALVSYANGPITLRNAATDDVAYRPVLHLVNMDLVGSLGIGKRVSVGALVPVILYQGGSENLPKTVSDRPSVPASGMGDVSLTLKGALVDNKNGGFGAAVVTAVGLPTGDRSSFQGDGAVNVQARALADFSLVFAGVQGSVGYRARTAFRTWPDPSAGGVRFGDELPWTVGIWVKPTVFGIDEKNRQRMELAAHGALPAGPVGPFGAGDPGSSALSPVMLTVSDRYEIGRFRDYYVIGGVDVGLTQAVGVPTLRGVAGIGWAPRDHDQDHDGVPDDVDQCPDVAEDKDGFEDSDGCPDLDNDEDGIVDKQDACPNLKGVESTDPRKNGCPVGDADHDGIPDDVDRCPHEPGVQSSDLSKNGCPVRDSDGDGILDDQDRCPDQAEDKDGFQDEDGCPDPDNDGDGIRDAEDACPNVAGEPSTDPAHNGCPNPDRDGDGILNDADKCPDQAEVYNGVDDDDGCPDDGGKPLVTVDEKDPKAPKMRLAKPIVFAGTADEPTVDPKSAAALRAIALELLKRRHLAIAIGVRPAPAAKGVDAAKVALARSAVIARALADLTRRKDVAESVAWDSVKALPGAGETGVGLMLVAAPASPAAKTEPAPLPVAK